MSVEENKVMIEFIEGIKDYLKAMQESIQMVITELDK